MKNEPFFTCDDFPSIYPKSFRQYDIGGIQKGTGGRKRGRMDRERTRRKKRKKYAQDLLPRPLPTAQIANQFLMRHLTPSRRCYAPSLPISPILLVHSSQERTERKRKSEKTHRKSDSDPSRRHYY